MRWRCGVVAMLLSGSAAVVAQEAPPAAQAAGSGPRGETSALPVRRVVLYKTGIGYFEHLGSVRNRQDVTIRFTSAQLNDVLKSLTTIDLGAGQITSISYNSTAPIDERLGALRLPLGAGATTLEVLAALRGARIEVYAGGSPVAGRLLSVERQRREKNGDEVMIDTLSLVTDGGSVHAYELAPPVRVRITEPGLRQELARYLDVVGSTREQDVRRMVISTSGRGERPLFVSYISEVPIWKTTYRLVLRDNGAKPLLQGWAIVDNTIGEDWKGVELSLVAGAPQSFIQNVSQPYYGRRPTVPLPGMALLTPQTHQAAIHVEKQAAPLASPGRFTGDDVQRGIERGIPGGTFGGVVGGLPSAPPPPAPPAAPVRVYEQLAGQTPAADAAPAGDLFEYRIREPVTLQKNQSALVPIVNAEIDAEKVAIWNRAPGSGRPLRAVWITNASTLTLDGGSISVIDGNAFAGEGLIEPLKPGERRLLSYAADLGMLVDAKLEAAPARLVRVRAHDGIVIQQSEERASWTYTARNEEPHRVTLIVEHRRRPGWELVPGETPAESTPNSHRFRLVVNPGQGAKLLVREVRAAETRVAIGDFTEAHITQLTVAGAPSDALRSALAPMVARRSELSELERQLAALEGQRNTIVQDQQRLRENMKALRGSAEERVLLQRYTRQLDDQETRLDALRSESSVIAKRRDAARAELHRLIAGFAYEER